MTSANEHNPTAPVAYKIPRPLRARLHRIRDYYKAELGRAVTLPDALERMTAECERMYGLAVTAEISRDDAAPGRVSNSADHGGA